jgi:2-hydroxyacyl-CoA lyase 1
VCVCVLGAAYARAETELREFVEMTHFPFLASPMGKGVIPDNHPRSGTRLTKNHYYIIEFVLCYPITYKVEIRLVSAARSFALKEADVILLVGARLNWMFHYGQPPKYSTSYTLLNIDTYIMSNTSSFFFRLSFIGFFRSNQIKSNQMIYVFF